MTVLPPVERDVEDVHIVSKRNLASPAIKVQITLKELSFVVKNNKKSQDGTRADLALVDRVSGWFEPAQMSALMGPSGSGKTTLLDLLAGRKTSGKVAGELLFSGVRPSREYQKRYCGYVEQFDTLLPILTVREMLRYTSELKRPLSEPLASKQAAVEALISGLGLARCADVRIGSPSARGISGGQAKRTNIAIALITSPRVLFLDEPTTGLDSYTANEVMKAVQALARSGVTVVATIHSPTAFCFSLFDSLMMLVGGRVVYFGPQDQHAVQYFQACGPFLEQHPDGFAGPGSNSAEYLVDIITEGDRDGRGPAYADAYASSSLAEANAAKLQAYVDGYKTTQLPEDLAKELATKSATVTPPLWGIWVYTKYRTLRNYQDPAFLLPRIMDKFTIAVLVMTLYLGIGDNLAADNIINISAVLFMWSATTGFVAASYIPSLVLERGLFVRERNDGLYLAPTYLTAKLMDELMINAVASLGISAFTFYGIGLLNNFAVFYVSYFVGVAVGIALAYFVASFAPNMDVANALLPTYAVTLLFFAGFLITFDEMPPWWKWYSYIDFARYSWGAVMVNQFKHHHEPWINGKTVLQYYGLARENEWAQIGYCSLFFVFFYVCTALILTFKTYQLR
ncbi:ABC transporter G family member 2 [Tetrabaena socialis]|uniref:ABC transporter G family member 2 n=1 Tax=Tetrabaena socialis TaxID=47790 RepID=A0A2J8AER4_9CHLO|nr:ABC transporter G family member 2 [Tetrabaena socialis]|eukprot:PNH11015.1 ABC transporter G family member 2 [Tetrabaena socialis]